MLKSGERSEAWLSGRPGPLPVSPGPLLIRRWRLFWRWGWGVHAWLGNAWADFVASVALHVVWHSPSFHKALEIRLSEAIANA
eukprot:2310185-Pyramimonas_sp.AAC.1